jgi:hypothetical protein
LIQTKHKIGFGFKGSRNKINFWKKWHVYSGMEHMRAATLGSSLPQQNKSDINLFRDENS